MYLVIPSFRDRNDSRGGEANCFGARPRGSRELFGVVPARRTTRECGLFGRLTVIASGSLALQGGEEVNDDSY